MSDEPGGQSSSGPGAMRPLRIGVIGSAAASDDACLAARAVGRLIAEAGALLVCGGGAGVMAAAAEGAARGGGPVLGLLPGDDAAAAAGGVSIPIPTGFGEGRNTLVVKASEAVIAISGGWGTLNEAALCMKLGRPLIGLLDTLGPRFSIERFGDPTAAVARALELAGQSRRAPSAGDGRGTHTAP